MSRSYKRKDPEDEPTLENRTETINTAADSWLTNSTSRRPGGGLRMGGCLGTRWKERGASLSRRGDGSPGRRTRRSSRHGRPSASKRGGSSSPGVTTVTRGHGAGVLARARAARHGSTRWSGWSLPCLLHLLPGTVFLRHRGLPPRPALRGRFCLIA